MDPRVRAWAVACAVGVPILLVFFAWHWFSIRPVWTVLAEGAVGVAIAAGGIAWGWRLARSRGRLAGARGGLALGAHFAGGVLLQELVGLARGPTADPRNAAEVLAELPFALLPAVLVAIAGWRLSGSWKGAAAFGLAGLVLLVYLGGAIMHRGGVGLGLGLFAILLPGYLLAGAAYGAIEGRS